MFHYLLKVRYVVVVIVLISILHSIAFLVMGANIAIHAYVHLARDAAGGGMTRPGVELLHSLDFLFVSLVLMVLALGIAKLFFLNLGPKEIGHLPLWLRIESISELKVMLWETILTTLLIVGLSDLIRELFTPLDWSALVLPVAILLLSMSLYFIRQGRDRSALEPRGGSHRPEGESGPS
jgi:uncharacterized membrane protein YqhA